MEGEPILPLDIVLQTFMFLIITMVGVTHIPGEFKEIRATVELEQQTWDNLRNRPSFYTWDTGGGFSVQSTSHPSQGRIFWTSLLDSCRSNEVSKQRLPSL